MSTPDNAASEGTPDEGFRGADYAGGVDDAGTFDPAEALTGQDLEEPYDTGYSPPDREPKATSFGTTADEARDGETLDQRLAQEVPDVDEAPDVSGGSDEDGEAVVADVPDPRAGRLLAPDEGFGEDTEQAAVAEDVGLAGSAASAEEAAVHVVDEDRIDDTDADPED